MRRWGRADFRRAALVAIFMRAGFSARWSTAIVSQFTDALLERVARARSGDYRIAIFDSVSAFLEAPPDHVRKIMADGTEYRWCNDRLLIAVYEGTPPGWHGFDNTVFLPDHLCLDGLPSDEAARLDAARHELRGVASGAHARAEEYEQVFKVDASRWSFEKQGAIGKCHACHRGSARTLGAGPPGTTAT